MTRSDVKDIRNEWAAGTRARREETVVHVRTRTVSRRTVRFRDRSSSPVLSTRYRDNNIIAGVDANYDPAVVVVVVVADIVVIGRRAHRLLCRDAAGTSILIIILLLLPWRARVSGLRWRDDKNTSAAAAEAAAITWKRLTSVSSPLSGAPTPRVAPGDTRLAYTRTSWHGRRSKNELTIFPRIIRIWYSRRRVYCVPSCAGGTRAVQSVGDPFDFTPEKKSSPAAVPRYRDVILARRRDVATAERHYTAPRFRRTRRRRVINLRGFPRFRTCFYIKTMVPFGDTLKRYLFPSVIWRAPHIRSPEHAARPVSRRKNESKREKNITKTSRKSKNSSIEQSRS